jgi:hypothetical protein
MSEPWMKALVKSAPTPDDVYNHNITRIVVERTVKEIINKMRSERICYKADVEEKEYADLVKDVFEARGWVVTYVYVEGTFHSYPKYEITITRK